MQSLQRRGLMILALVGIVLSSGSFLIHGFSQAARVLLTCSFLQSLATYWALNRTIHRSNRVFFSVFAGDALLRFVVLGAAVWGLQWMGVSPVVPLLTLAGGYLLFSLLQVPFLMRVR